MLLRSFGLSLLLSSPVLAQTTPPVPAAALPSPDSLWSKASEGLVIIEGNQHTGDGFLTVVKGATCVITSQETALLTRGQSVKTASGKALPPMRFFLADNGGVALGRLDKAPEGLVTLEPETELGTVTPKSTLISALSDKSIQKFTVKAQGLMDISVDKLGNLAKGVTPVPGHPVLNPLNGKVVAVLTPTYALKLSSSPLLQPGSNRPEMFVSEGEFALSRRDKVEKWQELSTGRARDESMRLEKFQDHNRQLAAFFQMGDAYKETDEVGRAYLKYKDDMAKTKRDAAYYESQYSQFVGYFPTLAKRDMDVLKRDSAYFYPYHRQQAEVMLRIRTDLVAKAAELIKGASGPFTKNTSPR